MSLIRPEIFSRPSRSSARSPVQEPVVVERAGVVAGVDVAEEQVRATDAALGRVDPGADAHLDTRKGYAVVGQADGFRFAACAGRC